MQEDLLCIKIKDGLYIGNRRPAEDVEFLITNKFGYIVNCTSELANHFEGVQGIHYLKLKYERIKPHKLWGDTYKKLLRFYAFIEEADQQAECCLVYSNLGNNRCCAVIIAYLMKKFLWTYDKTLNYVLSKKVEMKLSASYVATLRRLEQQLQQEQPLSNDWRRPYLSEEERVIANTYANTIEIKFEPTQRRAVERESKRVVWRDRLEKLLAKKAKEDIKQQLQEAQKEVKNQKSVNEVSRDLKTKPVKSFEVQATVPRKSKKKSEVLPKSLAAVQRPLEKKKPLSAKERAPLKEDDSIFKLIKKKLKESRQGVTFDETDEISSDRLAQDVHSNQVTPVYNLTVNNFINPSISIFTKNQQEEKFVMRPASGDRRLKHPAEEAEEADNKISRTFSQKEHRSLHKDKQKATNISASLMKSLISLQNDMRRQQKIKNDAASKASQYKSATAEPLLARVESPKEPKKMEKSMSFECRRK